METVKGVKASSRVSYKDVKRYQRLLGKAQKFQGNLIGKYTKDNRMIRYSKNGNIVEVNTRYRNNQARELQVTVMGKE